MRHITIRIHWVTCDTHCSVQFTVHGSPGLSWFLLVSLPRDRCCRRVLMRGPRCAGRSRKCTKISSCHSLTVRSIHTLPPTIHTPSPNSLLTSGRAARWVQQRLYGCCLFVECSYVPSPCQRLKASQHQDSFHSSGRHKGEC